MRLSSASRLTALFTNPKRSLTRYAGVALLAASVDWLSKLVAVQTLGVGEDAPLWDRFSLLVTYNMGGAGGVMVGPYTWHVNVLVTGFALAMITIIVRQLAVVDARSTIALGMVAGGAIGNMGSMLTGPEGVADFFAVRVSDEMTIVMNGADAFLWSGALLLVPVVVRLLQAIRAERIAVPVHVPRRA